MRIALIYTILAVIATVANIGAQDLVTRFYQGPLPVILSVFVGTGAGLVVKYLLDKRYIFAFQSKSLSHDSQVFFLYSIMGIVTTLVFWGFEFSFHLLFETKEMRYLGGILGLAVGYLTKYHLDKRYVFRTEAT